MPSESIYLNTMNNSSLERSLKASSEVESGNLLGNLLAFGGQKVSGFSSAKVLEAYLKLIKMLLDKLPITSLVEDKVPTEHSKGKGKAIEVILIDDSDDEDDEEIVERARQKVGTSKNLIDSEGDTNMSGPQITTTSPISPIVKFDPRTLNYLHSLYTPTVLTQILSLSTRYSSTTRPALASFLISLLQSCPTKREVVLNTIMYGSGSPGERGGGLLRELWRGFIRAGPLGRTLGGSERERSSSSVMSSLVDTKLAGDWSMLILLSELFKKCLLTLGDDEFHSSKNPLSIDEVVGLSGLLRNLVFSLYWQEGVLLAEKGREGERVVIGTRMGVESLRTLATALLQQIHARE